MFPKTRIPIIGKVKIKNSKVCKTQSSEFQCLVKPKFKIPMFEKARIQNSNVWKSQNSEF